MCGIKRSVSFSRDSTLISNLDAVGNVELPLYTAGVKNERKATCDGSPESVGLEDRMEA